MRIFKKHFFHMLVLTVLCFTSCTASSSGGTAILPSGVLDLTGDVTVFDGESIRGVFRIRFLFDESDASGIRHTGRLEILEPEGLCGCAIVYGENTYIESGGVMMDAGTALGECAELFAGAFSVTGDNVTSVESLKEHSIVSAFYNDVQYTLYIGKDGGIRKLDISGVRRITVEFDAEVAE